MDGLKYDIYCECAPERPDDDAAPGHADGRVALVTVSEVRRRTGLTRKALLVYEERGLVLPAARTEGGYRLYDHRSLRRLQLVTWARGLGFTLAEANEFLQAFERCCGEGQRLLRVLVERKLAETALLLDELDVRQDELRREAGDVAGYAAGRDLQLAGAAE